MVQHSRFDILATLFTLAFVAATAWLCWRVATSSSLWWPEVTIAALFLLCTCVCVAYMPRYTYINSEQIVVKKVLGELRFKRNEANVKQLQPSDLSGGVRTFGSGGAFGYLGWHRMPNVGKCFVLLKNRTQNLALIEHGEKRYIVHLNLGQQ